MVPLDNEELNEVTGDGITFAWTNFRALVDPSSYIEQTGQAPTAKTNAALTTGGCTTTGQTNQNYNCWRRSDLRWYGSNVSAVGTTTFATVGAGPRGTTWTSAGGAGTDMTQCGSFGINGLGCPRGGPINTFAAHDNPYILRAFQYKGDGSTTTLGSTDPDSWVATYQGDSNAVTSAQTVLEWLAPKIRDASVPLGNATDHSETGQPFYRLSFWGEIEVGRGGTNFTGTGTCPGSTTLYCGNNSNILKSQTILQGNAAGSELRFFRFGQTATPPGLTNPYNPLLGVSNCYSVNGNGSFSDGTCSTTAGVAYSNQTLAIQYKSYLRGDLRFSVAQTENTPVLGTPVVFDANEGMYFRNSFAYLPIGQPFYQALTINVPRSTSSTAVDTSAGVVGNITLEMPLLPNIPTVYTKFYSLSNCGTDAGSPSARDCGYETGRGAQLYRLPVITDTTSANTFLPARSAASITNYATLSANYDNTHGRIGVGDWFVCQGVGCQLPRKTNTVAEASAGIGRNAWNSNGDGLFFHGLTAYNAYAYKADAVDVRRSNDQYTSLAYYGNYANCAPPAAGAGVTEYTTCGYGGAYRGNGGSSTDGTAATGKLVTSQASFTQVEQFWQSDAGTAVGTATRNVIAVPANTALNLGDINVQGMQINYLRLTTLGAQL